MAWGVGGVYSHIIFFLLPFQLYQMALGGGRVKKNSELAHFFKFFNFFICPMILIGWEIQCLPYAGFSFIEPGSQYCDSLMKLIDMKSRILNFSLNQGPPGVPPASDVESKSSHPAVFIQNLTSERPPKGQRKVIKRSPKSHQKVTERLLKGHQKVNKRSTKVQQKVTKRSPKGHWKVTDCFLSLELCLVILT